jgi:hypothetical protein
MGRAIPDNVLQFLQTSIPSVWTLELLLLMRRSPDRSWSAQELDRELRGSALIVSRALAKLIAAGLVIEESSGVYRYQPARPVLGETIELLAKIYADYPVAVTQAILAAPSEQIRTFADAFRLKKD